MRTIKQWYNHKIKRPGSVSFYTTDITVGANAHNKKELLEMLTEVAPGLEKYLYERGIVFVSSRTLPPPNTAEGET